MNNTYAAYIAGYFIFLCLLKKYTSGGGRQPPFPFPDLSGKVIVVTGANQPGIGFQTVLEMAKLKPKMIILACRDTKRDQNAVNEIKKEGLNCVEFMQLDLNDLESVRGFADNFKEKYDKLDILCNNAGIMALPKR